MDIYLFIHTKIFVKKRVKEKRKKKIDKEPRRSKNKTLDDVNKFF